MEPPCRFTPDESAVTAGIQFDLHALAVDFAIHDGRVRRETDVQFGDLSDLARSISRHCQLQTAQQRHNSLEHFYVDDERPRQLTVSNPFHKFLR
jgi:hypothetical protein